MAVAMSASLKERPKTSSVVAHLDEVVQGEAALGGKGVDTTRMMGATTKRAIHTT